MILSLAQSWKERRRNLLTIKHDQIKGPGIESDQLEQVCYGDEGSGLLEQNEANQKSKQRDSFGRQAP
jgi:hypothetical protein